MATPTTPKQQQQSTYPHRPPPQNPPPLFPPTGSQSLLRVTYSGINPADIKHATLGLHSSIAGYDMSGEVLSTGPNSPFQPGDSIFGLNAPAPNRPLCLGAHQDYAIADGLFWYKIPEGGRVGLREAATLPVMTLTAADGLFNLLSLGFPEAGIKGAEGRAVLIWGGGSSVGVAAIQLVKAAGHGPIFATASKKNHEALRELGVDYCFDYKDEDVVEQIRKAIRDGGERVCFALDAVGAGCFAEGKDFKKSSPAMTAASILDEGEDVHDVKLACVLLVKQDPRYKLCFAARDANSPLLMARVADPEAWQEMQKKVMAWVLENFGNGKYVGCPNITVAKGAEACLEAMQRSAEGKSSFEKIAVEHPL